MNVRQLSQLRYLKLEINAERKLLNKLIRAVDGVGQARGAAVQRGSTSDPTGYLACEIAYLKALIADNMKKCICELLRLVEFINSIEDSELRVIFKERYVRCRTWTQIAFLLGGHDEQVPRRRHDRYLQSRGEKHTAGRKKTEESTFCTQAR